MDLSGQVEEIFASSDADKLEASCEGFSKRIISKEIKLVSLVEALGPKLTNTDVQTRVKAVEILAFVFAGLPSDFLLEQELNFIITFLLDRLKDHHIVIPKVILCIHAVIQSKNLPSHAPKALLYQLFREANIQSHVHKIRRTFFLIIRFLILNKLEELKEMSSDFVVNFIQSMEGEKDPRNLVLLFNIIPSILSHFPLTPFTEDFFEVLACYFPIDFSPSVNIPGVEVITRDELANSLHVCLSHTNQFSSFLVPLALEKLESSLIDAKLDALRLLEMCCEKSYQPKDFEPYLGQIWHNLRREIFLGGNESVEKQCISFLKGSFKMISRNDVILDHCLAMIFTECNHHLCEPELRLIHPTSRILVAMAESSEIACRAVLQRALPVLHEQLSIKTTVTEKKTILVIMGVLISAGRLFPEVHFADLLKDWDEVIAMWFTLLTHCDPQFVYLSLELFSRVLPNSADLTKNNRIMLQEHMISLLKKDHITQESSSAVISTMNEFSRHYPQEFLDTAVTKLIEELSSENSSIITSETSSVNIFAALAECSPNNEAITEKVVKFLLYEIEKVPHSIHALSSLARAVEKGCCINQGNRPAVSVTKFIDLVCLKLMTLEKIVKLFVVVCQDIEPRENTSDCAKVTSQIKQIEGMNCKLASVPSNEEIEMQSHTPGYNDEMERILQISTGIVRNLVKACNEDVQAKLVETFWGKVRNSGVKQVLEEMNVLLLESLLCPLRPKIEIEMKSELMQHLISEILSSDKCVSTQKLRKVKASQIRLYVVLLNKLEPDEDFQKALSNIRTRLHMELGFNESKENGMAKVNSDSAGSTLNDKMECNIPDDSSSEDQCEMRKNKTAVNLLMWVVKALAMRGIEDLDVWITEFVTLLEDEEVGKDAAEGFGVIMSDCEISLNAQSYCKYRFLYKQRLFLMTVPKLVLAHRNCSSEQTRANYIRALSSQLKHVPKQVLFMEIDNVFPLLVASLSCESSSKLVLLSTLTALFELMSSEDSKDKLKEYFHDVTPRLLRLTRFKDSMDVRKLALRCLYTCAKFPTHIVLPLKQTVVDELKSSLDDPKRLVRKEAAVTRNKWILIGEVGGN